MVETSSTSQKGLAFEFLFPKCSAAEQKGTYIEVSAPSETALFADEPDSWPGKALPQPSRLEVAALPTRGKASEIFALVYRQMRSQDGVGSIINISSGTGHPAGSPTLVSYGAAKAGLNHLTRSLAEEWGPHARVNSLALGATMTDNFQSFVLPKDDPQGEAYFRNVPLGRAGTPAEVGRTCVFLCSGAADFINGTTIEIDGGMLPGVLYDAGLKTITDLL